MTCLMHLEHSAHVLSIVHDYKVQHTLDKQTAGHS